MCGRARQDNRGRNEQAAEERDERRAGERRVKVTESAAPLPDVVMGKQEILHVRQR